MAEIDHYLYQFRVIIVGNSTVGKSCMLRRFTENRFIEHNDPTVGVDFHTRVVQVKGHNLKLQLWDTAGQERFRAITRAYYRNAVGVILVFDIADQGSFAKLPDWIEDVEEASKPHSPVFLLVGNKSDQEISRQVLARDAQEYAKKLGIGYIEVSAKTGQKIDEAFTLLTRNIYEAVQTGKIKIGEGWDGVKVGEEKLGARSSVSLNDRKGNDSQKSKGCCS